MAEATDPLGVGEKLPCKKDSTASGERPPPPGSPAFEASARRPPRRRRRGGPRRRHRAVSAAVSAAAMHGWGPPSTRPSPTRGPHQARSARSPPLAEPPLARFGGFDRGSIRLISHQRNSPTLAQPRTSQRSWPRAWSSASRMVGGDEAASRGDLGDVGDGGVKRCGSGGGGGCCCDCGCDGVRRQLRGRRGRGHPGGRQVLLEQRLSKLGCSSDRLRWAPLPEHHLFRHSHRAQASISSRRSRLAGWYTTRCAVCPSRAWSPSAAEQGGEKRRIRCRHACEARLTVAPVFDPPLPRSVLLKLEPLCQQRLNLFRRASGRRKHAAQLGKVESVEAAIIRQRRYQPPQRRHIASLLRTIWAQCSRVWSYGLAHRGHHTFQGSCRV